MVIMIICLLSAAAAGMYVIGGIGKEKTKVPGMGRRHKKTAENTESLPDYSNYKMLPHERLMYIGVAAVVLLMIGKVFFNNAVIAIALSSLALFYPIIKKRRLIVKKKMILNLQFKDAIQAIASSLAAGRSVETSFKAALDDLKLLYQGEQAYMVKELELINRKIEMNETIENAMLELSKRADIEDISNFVDVFIICKNTGGNLIEVIKNTSNIINQKIETMNEIDVILTEQKFSQKVLNVIPFILLSVISFSSPDYVKPLYTAAGHLVMLVVLLLLVAAYFIGSKIVDIKV